MKIQYRFISLFFLIMIIAFSWRCVGQNPDCSQTRLGKILLKKSDEKSIKVHVDKAGTHKIVPAGDSPDRPLSNRVVNLKGDTVLTLEFERIDIMHECLYLLRITRKNRSLNIFHLSSEGSIDAEESTAGKPDQLEAMKYQPDVDRFLKYFE